MFGFRFLKVPPTAYALQFKGGRVVREGTGMSLVYFAPSSTIVLVPLGSSDVPFMFAETTADFQAVTVQGHLTYRVKEPKKLAGLLDFTLKGDKYASEDPQKLPSRIAQAAQAATRAEVQGRSLREALAEADPIARSVRETLHGSPALEALGIEVLQLAILALRPAPETARALEAEARERLLREADDAIYGRRQNAVEKERQLRESELETEMAVGRKRYEIESAQQEAKIALEGRRRELVQVESENLKTQAEAQAFAAEATLKPLKEMDPRALQVLAAGHGDPRSLVAMAFQELAANAGKVGNLNISPELLDSLMRPAREARR